MITLADFAIGIGVFNVLAALPLLVNPAVAQRALKAFPRHDWSGRILVAVALAWSVYLVWEMPLGWFDAYKGWLYVAGPILYLLIVIFMNELLAARALGGVLLLVANPVLEAASFKTSPLRLVLVVLAYAWVIVGIALVLAPYRFRKTAEALCATVGRCRALGGLILAFGAVLIGLGLLAF